MGQVLNLECCQNFRLSELPLTTIYQVASTIFQIAFSYLFLC